MTAADWPAVKTIYEEGIATRRATFETSAGDWESWDAGHLQEARLVSRRAAGARVEGWAALSGVSDRCVYGGVAEVSVYVGEAYRGEGVGRRLLEALVEASEAANVWTLQAGIFAENEVSLRLFECVGFRIVGRRERLGRLDGEWRDVMLLERRSDKVGVDLR